jgi:hypothetical protein
MEDNIDRIKGELEEARENLHQTVSEVNRKVEAVSTQLQPGRLAERHPLLSACIAGALGFVSGNRDHGPIANLVLGGLLGAMLIEVWNDGSRDRDRRA